MYHPDQYYEQHMRYLNELRERAAHNRMLAALAAEQPAGLRAALGRLPALRQALGAWLAQPAQPSEQPACTCGC